MSLTKDQLIKMLEIAKSDHGPNPFIFYNGYDAGVRKALDILWPRLLGLDKSLRNVSWPDPNLAEIEQALKQHGVSDE